MDDNREVQSANTQNYLSLQNNATIISSSSELPNAPATNVLSSTRRSIWMTGEGMPQHFVVGIEGMVQRPKFFRYVGFDCWHDYKTNPSIIELLVSSNKDSQFIKWSTLYLELMLIIFKKAGIQIFSIDPLDSHFNFLKVIVKETYGASKAYLNQFFLFEDNPFSIKSDVSIDQKRLNYQMSAELQTDDKQCNSKPAVSQFQGVSTVMTTTNTHTNCTLPDLPFSSANFLTQQSQMNAPSTQGNYKQGNQFSQPKNSQSSSPTEDRITNFPLANQKMSGISREMLHYFSSASPQNQSFATEGNKENKQSNINNNEAQFYKKSNEKKSLMMEQCQSQSNSSRNNRSQSHQESKVEKNISFPIECSDLSNLSQQFPLFNPSQLQQIVNFTSNQKAEKLEKPPLLLTQTEKEVQFLKKLVLELKDNLQTRDEKIENLERRCAWLENAVSQLIDKQNLFEKSIQVKSNQTPILSEQIQNIPRPPPIDPYSIQKCKNRNDSQIESNSQSSSSFGKANSMNQGVQNLRVEKNNVEDAINNDKENVNKIIKDSLEKVQKEVIQTLKHNLSNLNINKKQKRSTSCVEGAQAKQEKKQQSRPCSQISNEHNHSIFEERIKQLPIKQNFAKEEKERTNCTDIIQRKEENSKQGRNQQIQYGYSNSRADFRQNTSSDSRPNQDKLNPQKSTNNPKVIKLLKQLQEKMTIRSEKVGLLNQANRSSTYDRIPSFLNDSSPEEMNEE